MFGRRIQENKRELKKVKEGEEMKRVIGRMGRRKSVRGKKEGKRQRSERRWRNKCGAEKEDEMKGNKKKIFKITFWDVAGLKNKDRKFWEGLKDQDVLILNETQIDRKGWEQVREKMPKEYVWEV